MLSTSGQVQNTAAGTHRTVTADKNFASTISTVRTGAHSSSWSVFWRRSSLKLRMVSSGQNSSSTMRVEYSTRP